MTGVELDSTFVAALITAIVALSIAICPLIFATSVSKRLGDLQVERLLDIDKSRNDFTSKAQECFQGGEVVKEAEVMDPYNRFCALLVTSEALLGARWVNGIIKQAEDIQSSIWKCLHRIPGVQVDLVKANQLYNVRRHLMLESIRAKFSWYYRLGGWRRRRLLKRNEKRLLKELGSA